eukprot:6582792-Prymnesium_polylepis.1
MGSRKLTLVVLSTTMTVMEMVMRQMPPSIAAAPMSAYEPGVDSISSPTSPAPHTSTSRARGAGARGHGAVREAAQHRTEHKRTALGRDNAQKRCA